VVGKVEVKAIIADAVRNFGVVFGAKRRFGAKYLFAPGALN
jgi:hypothetical protein